MAGPSARSRKRPAEPSCSSGEPAPSPPPPALSISARTAIAMQMEMVLSLIATKATPRVLHTLRGTCSTWNRRFASELRRRRHCSVKLRNPSKTHGSRSSMSKFTELHRSKSISQMCFTGFRLFRLVPYSSGASDFFKVCGGDVRSLTFTSNRGFTLGCPIRFGTLDRELFDLVPELEELEIHASALGRSSYRKEFRIKGQIPNLKKLTMVEFVTEPVQALDQALLNELVRAAVGLEELVLRHTCKMSVGVALRDFSTNLNNLRSLACDDFAPNDLQILTELASRPQCGNPLRLHKFHCTICKTQEIQLFHAFLDAQGPTLQELAIHIISNRAVNRPPLRIPPLAALHSLVILKAGRVVRAPVLLDRGTLHSNFPQLKNFILLDLTYCGVNANGTWREELESAAHSGVTELVLDGGKMGTLRLLELLRLRFPALTSLALEVNTRSTIDEVSSLWTEWPALETLSIKLGRAEAQVILPYSSTPELELNEFLTGIPKAAFPELMRVLGPRPGSQALKLGKLRGLLAKHKSKSGISDLKQLRRFRLEIVDSNSELSLTDVGGSLGLSASQNLQFVMVVRGINYLNTSACTMSQRCRDLLREALGPFAVINLQ